MSVNTEPNRDFWLINDAHDCYIHVTEGTGDNLLPEDTEEGYVDYIYYSIFDSLSDVHVDEESDGGQIMLTELYTDFTTEQIIDMVLNFIGWADPSDFSTYN